MDYLPSSQEILTIHKHTKTVIEKGGCGCRATGGKRDELVHQQNAREVKLGRWEVLVFSF